MPTYEYACKSCEHRFDIVQSFSDDALTTCPECSQDALRKVFSAAGIIFKGDGWHIKDYGNKKTSSSTTAVGDDASSSDGSSSRDGTKPSKDGAKSKDGASKGSGSKSKDGGSSSSSGSSSEGSSSTSSSSSRAAASD